jgi:hypothetical protein
MILEIIHQSNPIIVFWAVFCDLFGTVTVFFDNDLNNNYLSLFKEANLLYAILFWCLKFRGLFNKLLTALGAWTLQRTMSLDTSSRSSRQQQK